MMILRIFPLALLSAAALFAQSAEKDELLARGRERILEAIQRLPRYTCTQTVDRSEFREAVPRLQRSCDQIIADRKNGVAKTELVRTNRLRLEVEVTDDGFEIFSWPGAGRISSERVQDFADQGLMGTGAFGPFLINIFGSAGVTFWPEGAGNVDGKELRQYRYLVPLAASHYRVEAQGATRVIPFDGRFWLDPVTADLRRLTVRTGELSRSTGNCEATTTVDFTRARIGASEHLLASKSVLHVLRRDAAEQENVTTYAACHEFRGESEIHYDETPEAVPASAAPETAGRKGEASAIPAGVRVTIHFADGIDSATSAAGDLVPARVRHTDAKPRKRVLPDGGAPAQCRIVRLETAPKSAQLNVTVACEAVEVNGRWVPFAAVPEGPANLLETVQKTYTSGGQTAVIRHGRRAPGRGGTFTVPMTGLQTRVGPFTSEWITIVPQKGGVGR